MPKSQNRLSTDTVAPISEAPQTITDVKAELKKVQLQLEQSRFANESLINSLGEGLIALNEVGEVTRVNTYAANALGFSREELIGHWFSDVIVAVDRFEQVIDQVTRPFTRALTSGQPISEYMHYLRKDGTVMPVFVTTSPIIMNNKPVGVIEVFRDLTEENRLDIAKEEFVSLASHQLRTPATGVKSILAMLSRGDFGEMTPQQTKYVRRAMEANDRQLQIIEDLLNVARVDAGRMQLEPDWINLTQVVREVANGHLEALQGRQQRLSISGPQKLSLFADASKLRMVVDNIISNASKYSAPGEDIEVVLSEDGDCAQVAVRDFGVGITEKDQQRLFKKFSRLDNDLSALVMGTGLGLFLAKSIIDLHHGKITVVSNPGKGSIFTVILPIKPLTEL